MDERGNFLDCAVDDNVNILSGVLAEVTAGDLADRISSWTSVRS